MNQILKAAAFALKAHNGQFRKYTKTPTPYIYHPMRVAGRVTLIADRLLGSMKISSDLVTEDAVTAAWLHDVLEDTSVTVEELRKEFPFTVVKFVEDLTNPSKGLALPRSDRKAIDRAHIARASRTAKLIKLIDRIDNLSEMRDAPPDFVKLYKVESLLLLNEALRGVDAKLEKELEVLTN